MLQDKEQRKIFMFCNEGSIFFCSQLDSTSRYSQIKLRASYLKTVT